MTTAVKIGCEAHGNVHLEVFSLPKAISGDQIVRGTPSLLCKVAPGESVTQYAHCGQDLIIKEVFDDQ